MRPIAAGRLNKPVTILRATKTRNAHNETVPTWAPAGDLPDPMMAEIQFSAGRERFDSAEKAAVAPAIFRFRYIDAGPLVTDRLRYKGVDYEISSSVEKSQPHCREVIAAARGE